jgi:hypothetical protein
MLHKPALVVLILSLAFSMWGMTPATAQEQPDAWTTADHTLNMRFGPGQDYTVITSLPPVTGLVIEALNGDFSWLLAHTTDGDYRGWVARQFVRIRRGFDLESLPISDEIPVSFTSLEIPRGVEYAYEETDMAGGSDLMYARAEAIALTAYPIVPESLGRAREVYQRGQALGRDPHIIAKVGDCNSNAYYFLYPFGLGEYDLGEYGDLEGVINQFAGSLAVRTYAAHNGLNAGAVLDPLWASPAVCEPGESSLACEFRLHNPSVAVIMFGTNDMLALTPEQFDHYLRRVVNETIQAGVIPLLSTFPRHLASPERSIFYNQIVVRVALDCNVPLINLWLALEPLPSYGIRGDGFHLNGPLTSAGDLTEPNLQSGYPMRNLVTLQALDMIWREAMQ